MSPLHKEYPLDLFRHEHGRQPLWPSGCDILDLAQLLLQDFTIQEENCMQGLVLGAGSNLAVHGQMGQELSDLRLT